MSNCTECGEEIARCSDCYKEFKVDQKIYCMGDNDDNHCCWPTCNCAVVALVEA